MPSRSAPARRQQVVRRGRFRSISTDVLVVAKSGVSAERRYRSEGKLLGRPRLGRSMHRQSNLLPPMRRPLAMRGNAPTTTSSLRTIFGRSAERRSWVMSQSRPNILLAWGISLRVDNHRICARFPRRGGPHCRPSRSQIRLVIRNAPREGSRGVGDRGRRW